MSIFRVFSSKKSKAAQRLAEEIEILHNSPLLDPVWYRQNYPDLRSTPVDVARHYLEHGAREGRNPHPLFDTKFYLEQNPNLAASGANPLVHFILYGTNERRNPHPLFDIKWYLEQIAPAPGNEVNALAHYLNEGWKAGLRPTSMFDPNWYLYEYPDVQASGVEPLSHYLDIGWRETRRPTPWLDPVAHRQRYGLSIDPNPLVDYVRRGLPLPLSSDGDSPRPQAVGNNAQDVAHKNDWWRVPILFEARERNAETIVHSSGPRPLNDMTTYELSNNSQAAPTLIPANDFGGLEFRAATLRAIRDSGLFDQEYYRQTYSDVASNTSDPVAHWLDQGVREGRNPHPLFDTLYYLSTYPNTMAADFNPLLHYLLYGANEGRDPNPLFDTDWYLENNQDVRAAGINPLVHYLQHGAAQGRDPHCLFDVSFYLARCPDSIAASVNPLVHFYQKGSKEGRSPHILFDTAHYVAQNPEILVRGEIPLLHYLKRGTSDKLDPNPLFSTSFYLETYSGVVLSGLNPLVHFIKIGAAQAWCPHPLFDTSYYLEQNPEVRSNGVNPLAHYLAFGGLQGRRPNPLFNSELYLEENSDVAESKTPPLVHFVLYGASEGRRAWTAEGAIDFIRPHVVGPDSSGVMEYLSKARRPALTSGRMQIAVYTNSEGNYFFHEIRDLVVAGLQRIGVGALALTEKSARPDSVTHDLVIAPHEFFYCNEQGRHWRNHPMTRAMITFNTEQLQSRWFCFAMPMLLKSKLVIDMNFHTAASLRDLKLNAAFLPLGYLDAFDSYAPQASLPKIPALASLPEEVTEYQPNIINPLRARPLDVVFIGTVGLGLSQARHNTPSRREVFFSRNACRFSQYHCFFYLHWMDKPIVGGQNAELSTQAVIGLSQRTKILLNINADEMPYFQWQRIVLHGIWQKALVVSEKSYRIPGLVPGEHYYEGTLDEIPKAIDWFLRDPKGQEVAEKMRDAAFDVFTRKFNFAKILLNLVGELIPGSAT